MIIYPKLLFNNKSSCLECRPRQCAIVLSDIWIRDNVKISSSTNISPSSNTIKRKYNEIVTTQFYMIITISGSNQYLSILLFCAYASWARTNL